MTSSRQDHHLRGAWCTAAPARAHRVVVEDFVKVIAFSFELKDLISQLVVVRFKYVRFLKQLERKDSLFALIFLELYNENSINRVETVC